MAYIKIIAGDDGESHFEDVSFAKSSTGPEALVAAQACVSWDISQGPDGYGGKFHTTKVPKILLVLEGQIEVGVGSGEVRRFGPGDVMHAMDTTGRGHTSKLIGDPVCRVLTITTE